MAVPNHSSVVPFIMALISPLDDTWQNGLMAKSRRGISKAVPGAGEPADDICYRWWWGELESRGADGLRWSDNHIRVIHAESIHCSVMDIVGAQVQQYLTDIVDPIVTTFMA